MVFFHRRAVMSTGAPQARSGINKKKAARCFPDSLLLYRTGRRLRYYYLIRCRRFLSINPHNRCYPVVFQRIAAPSFARAVQRDAVFVRIFVANKQRIEVVAGGGRRKRKPELAVLFLNMEPTTVRFIDKTPPPFPPAAELFSNIEL
jgi:hypothetical protein